MMARIKQGISNIHLGNCTLKRSFIVQGDQRRFETSLFQVKCLFYGSFITFKLMLTLLYDLAFILVK